MITFLQVFYKLRLCFNHFLEYFAQFTFVLLQILKSSCAICALSILKKTALEFFRYYFLLRNLRLRFTD